VGLPGVGRQSWVTVAGSNGKVRDAISIEIARIHNVLSSALLIEIAGISVPNSLGETSA